MQYFEMRPLAAERGGGVSAGREFVISAEAFRFRRWLSLTVLFGGLAFYCEFHNADASFLGLFLFFLCLLLVRKLHFKVKEESLLVMASLGLQMTTTFVTGRRASRFVLHPCIYDVVINEGILANRVLFYLAVLLRDMDDPRRIGGVVPLFENMLPRLDRLEVIYERVQDVLLPNS